LVPAKNGRIDRIGRGTAWPHGAFNRVLCPDHVLDRNLHIDLIRPFQLCKVHHGTLRKSAEVVRQGCNSHLLVQAHRVGGLDPVGALWIGHCLHLRQLDATLADQQSVNAALLLLAVERQFEPLGQEDLESLRHPVLARAVGHFCRYVEALRCRPVRNSNLIGAHSVSNRVRTVYEIPRTC